MYRIKESAKSWDGDSRGVSTVKWLIRPILITNLCLPSQTSLWSHFVRQEQKENRLCSSVSGVRRVHRAHMCINWHCSSISPSVSVECPAATRQATQTHPSCYHLQGGPPHLTQHPYITMNTLEKELPGWGAEPGRSRALDGFTGSDELYLGVLTFFPCHTLGNNFVCTCKHRQCEM